MGQESHSVGGGVKEENYREYLLLEMVLSFDHTPSFLSGTVSTAISFFTLVCVSAFGWTACLIHATWS